MKPGFSSLLRLGVLALALVFLLPGVSAQDFQGSRKSPEQYIREYERNVKNMLNRAEILEDEARDADPARAVKLRLEVDFLRKLSEKQRLLAKAIRGGNDAEINRANKEMVEFVESNKDNFEGRYKVRGPGESSPAGPPSPPPAAGADPKPPASKIESQGDGWDGFREEISKVKTQ
ncbi:MAG: hypothetical protein SFY92_05005 [Verrucomicrobiae bacterium]|nr:hypothetical protein [Verrucomicrobiae bacterium]